MGKRPRDKKRKQKVDRTEGGRSKRAETKNSPMGDEGGPKKGGVKVTAPNIG